MTLLTIIGARPQIIKAAALSRAIAAWNAAHPDAPVHESILHTGQHYDDTMSAVFFRELGIPEPALNLHVGSGTHGVQTARMIEGIEAELLRMHYDGVVLYGDTNSTLAGAVAASKLHVPVFHIEAGLRSWNMTMPEEINRIVCDSLSSILFAPTRTAVTNLLAAGYSEQPGQVHFADGRSQLVRLSGDVMYDNSMYFASMAEEQSNVLERYDLQDRHFILATIHRPSNTDDAAHLTSIFTALLDIAEQDCIPVVLPLHPRTQKLLSQQLSANLLARVRQSPYMLLTGPASFFDIISLERHARIVMTDSGGVQKEAFFFSTPCVILRPETEWVEIVDAGAGIIADADYARICAAYSSLRDSTIQFRPLFGNGNAATYILSEILSY